MAISLNNHESRINSINTNISSLGTRITNLETNPPSTVAIVTINKSGTNVFPIPAQHVGKSFVVLSVSFRTVASNSYYPIGTSSISNGNSFSVSVEASQRGNMSGSISFLVSGNNIVASLSKSTIASTSIKVLFYK